MIDLTAEETHPLAAAATAHFRPRETARRLTSSTILRWILRGAKAP